MSREPVAADVTALGPYSPAIVAEGRFVYVSGQGPIRDGEDVSGTIAEETQVTLDNLFTILARRRAGPPTSSAAAST